jgi:DNA-binding NtrC family response regulator
MVTETGGVPVKGAIRRRALIADDEASVRLVLREMLTRLGYEPVLVADGQSAISLLASGGFQLLICDLTMPSRSGVEVLQYANEVAPALPAIITTGYDDWNQLDELSLSNLLGVLPKPFGMAELRAMLRDRLDQQMVQG